MAQDITVAAAGGEYMETVTLVAWHVAVGECVRAGDLVATVETAKAATDIEAPCDGVVLSVAAQVGDEVPVGAVVGRVGEPGEDERAAAAPPRLDEPSDDIALHDTVAARGPRSVGRQARAVASPLARRVAARLGVDLVGVRGSGPDGRIKSRDVEAAARDRPAAPARVGTDRPLVLLHGLGAGAAIWAKVAAALGGSARTIRPDLPGHGSVALPGRPDLQALADIMADALLAEGHDDVHLAGHSLGGSLAILLARSGSIRVRSLCLLAPAGLGPEIDGAFLAGFARASRVESVAPWLERLVADPAALPTGFAEASLALRAQGGDGVARLVDNLFPDGTQGFDMRASLAAIAVPTRIVWGRQDRIVPWRHALSAPPSAALHLLPGVGHLPQIEAPDIVAGILRRTMREA